MFRWLSVLFGKRSGTPGLRTLLARAKNSDAAVREQAAVALGEVPEAPVAEALVVLLQDAYTPVRQAAQRSLQQLGGVALPALLAALDHPDPEVGKVAAELLGALPDPAVVEPLIKALKYANRPVQLAARRGLVRLGPLAAEPLRAVSDEQQPWVRRQITEILEEIGGPPIQQPGR